MTEVSLESSEEVYRGGLRLWEVLIATSKYLCPTHLKIKGVSSLVEVQYMLNVDADLNFLVVVAVLLVK